MNDEQAAIAGDVPNEQAAPAGDAQELPNDVLAVGDIATPPNSTTEPEQEPTEEPTAKAEPSEPEKVVPETLEDGSKRKSDKEWQEEQEKAKESDELADRIARLEQDNKLLKFENENPDVTSDRYKERWEKMKASDRFKDADPAEMWELIYDPGTKIDKGAKQDAMEQATRNEGSVVATGGGTTPRSEFSQGLLSEGESWFGSKEKAKELYKKYGIK